MEVWIMEKQLLRDLELKEAPQCECKKHSSLHFADLKSYRLFARCKKAFISQQHCTNIRKYFFKKSVTLLA